VVAGLCVAGLLLPEAVAYASIAGLAPVHGVVGAIVSLLLYGVMGRSRYAIVAPTSSLAAILAAAAASAEAAQSPEQRLALAGQGRVLLLGPCKQHARDLLRSHPALADPQRSLWSVDEAVEVARALVDAR